MAIHPVRVWRAETISVAKAGTRSPATGAAQRPANAENSNGCSLTAKPRSLRTVAQYRRASAISRLPVARETAPSLARCADAVTLRGDELRALHQLRDGRHLRFIERGER